MLLHKSLIELANCVEVPFPSVSANHSSKMAFLRSSALPVVAYVWPLLVPIFSWLQRRFLSGGEELLIAFEVRQLPPLEVARFREDWQRECTMANL